MVVFVGRSIQYKLILKSIQWDERTYRAFKGDRWSFPTIWIRGAMARRISMPLPAIPFAPTANAFQLQDLMLIRDEFVLYNIYVCGCNIYNSKYPWSSVLKMLPVPSTPLLLTITTILINVPADSRLAELGCIVRIHGKIIPNLHHCLSGTAQL